MWEVAIITEIIKETKSNWRFVMESPLYDKIDYTPGMLIQLRIPDRDGSWVVRNYSVASWPNGTNKLELIVTNLEGGKMSNYLFNECKVGDEIQYRGPMGVFTLPEEIDRDLFFICTGSGISPFRSMINYITENGIKTKNIYMVFGTRRKEDIVYYEELQEIEKINENFKYIPVLSRQEWDGKSGYVHDVYLDLIKNRVEKPLFYLCGWSGMINDTRENLSKLGYEMTKDIRVEIFG
jgi:NAD(P)H-flavin reductase